MDAKWEDVAVDYKHNGHNCAQAVVHAICDEKGIDAAPYLELAAGFGLGMGTMEGSCGALAGAVMMKGLETKGQGTVPAVKQMTTDFKELCGAVVCKDIKGIDTGVVLCPCDDCVKNAVKIYK